MRVAAEAGLEHIVLLSGRGEEGAERAEEILKASGLSWNIVRASWFCQNFSESFMLEGILEGELVLPAGDTVEPFIDADDIADVAVAALTEPRHRNKLFEVTGPRALTFAQCIQEMSEALGRPLKYTTCSNRCLHRRAARTGCTGRHAMVVTRVVHRRVRRQKQPCHAGC